MNLFSLCPGFNSRPWRSISRDCFLADHTRCLGHSRTLSSAHAPLEKHPPVSRHLHHTVTSSHRHTLTPSHRHTITPSHRHTLTPSHCHISIVEKVRNSKFHAISKTTVLARIWISRARALGEILGSGAFIGAFRYPRRHKMVQYLWSM